MTEPIEFRIIAGDVEPVVNSIPVAIFRFVSEETNNGKTIVTVDEAIENPNAVDFFIIWLVQNVEPSFGNSDGRQYVCEYHGKLVIVWRLPKIGFSRFTLPLIRKTYPNLISSLLIDVQPITNPAAFDIYFEV